MLPPFFHKALKVFLSLEQLRVTWFHQKCPGFPNSLSNPLAGSRLFRDAESQAFWGAAPRAFPNNLYALRRCRSGSTSRESPNSVETCLSPLGQQTPRSQFRPLGSRAAGMAFLHL